MAPWSKAFLNLGVRTLVWYHLGTMKRFATTIICATVFFAMPAWAQDQTIQTLQRITDAAGPSGFEEPIRKVMVEYMKPLSSSLHFDGMGSIIAVQGSSGPR